MLTWFMYETPVSETVGSEEPEGAKNVIETGQIVGQMLMVVVLYIRSQYSPKRVHHVRDFVREALTHLKIEAVVFHRA